MGLCIILRYPFFVKKNQKTLSGFYKFHNANTVEFFSELGKTTIFQPSLFLFNAVDGGSFFGRIGQFDGNFLTRFSGFDRFMVELH